MKLALAMIVKPTDEEALALNRCLASVSKHVDGIFITITGENERCEQVAESFGATISYYEWDKNFAKARNFSFRQVPKEYTHIFWLDADDVVTNPEKIKPTIEENLFLDTFGMFYIYHLDEYKNPDVVHMKTRIIKNDGCAEWNEFLGEVHEDFKENRKVRNTLIQGITVVHMSDENRIDDSKWRNLEIAEMQIKKYKGDPRANWNYANALKGSGTPENNLKAIEEYIKFLNLSVSDDEKYIASLRIAECYWDSGNMAKAIDQARYAVGTKPHYPDAYTLLGHLYLATKRYEDAALCYVEALGKKPPYHSIIVYNPRDYDYVPLLHLGKAYIHMGKSQMALTCFEGCLKIYPKSETIKKVVEELKEAVKYYNIALWVAKIAYNVPFDWLARWILNLLPVSLKQAPPVAYTRNIRFIKKESSGRDLVFFCGPTEEMWTPETARTKGIGGSEEAVIHLSELLAQKGWNVTVYNNCGHKEQKFGNVTYKPFWAFNYRDKQDVVVLWRIPHFTDYELNAPVILMDLHDTISPGEFTEERLKKITRIMVKSRAHRDLFPNIPEEKFAIIPNGIWTDQFFNEQIKEDLVINTSSPDRSLTAYIAIVKKLKEKLPHVRFVWAYGWQNYDVWFKGDTKMMEWKKKTIADMEEAGIENLGRLSHPDIVDLNKRAKVFLYPSEFYEIDCISLTKAIAAGAFPVTTNFAAMGEKTGSNGYFVHSKKTTENWSLPNQHDYSVTDKRMLQSMAKAVEAQFKKPSVVNRHFADAYDWRIISSQWDDICKKNLQP